VESAAGPPSARRAAGRPLRGGALSSAILYVAIVAIWAGVLIPRWLRRDSSSPNSSSEPASDDLTTADDDLSTADDDLTTADDDLSTAEDDLSTAEPDAPVAEEPAPRPLREDPVPAVRAQARAEVRPEARAEVRPQARAEVRPQARAEVRPQARAEVRPQARREVPEARREAPRGERRDGLRDQEHKRVLSARRRLLGLLLILVIGSGALAFTKLAAWWVIVPPLTMLLGYLTLLRAAAKADGERRDMAPADVTRTTAAAPPATARPAAPVPAAPVPAAPVPAAPVRAAPPAPPRDAEVIDISATIGPVGEEFYDQYADAKLRAVGDLARALAS